MGRSKRKLAAILAVAAIAASACSGTGGSPKPSLPSSVGAGEGVLNLVAWAGYVDGGAAGHGEQVSGYDWVTPFEQATGCQVKVQVGVDSANVVQRY